MKLLMDKGNGLENWNKSFWLSVSDKKSVWTRELDKNEVLLYVSGFQTVK